LQEQRRPESEPGVGENATREVSEKEKRFTRKKEKRKGDPELRL